MASNLQILRDQLDALEKKEKLLLDRKRCNEEARQTLDEQYRRESQRLVQEADQILAELDAVRHVDTVTTDTAGISTSVQPVQSSTPSSTTAFTMSVSSTAPSGRMLVTDRHNRSRYGDPYVKPASISAGVWASKTAKDKQSLSHVGRIDDTAAGMPSPRSCTACVDSGRSSSCRIYTTEAYAKHCRTGTGGSCSNCLVRCCRCSLVPAKGVTSNSQPGATDDDEESLPKRQQFEGK